MTLERTQVPDQPIQCGDRLDRICHGRTISAEFRPKRQYSSSRGSAGTIASGRSADNASVGASLRRRSWSLVLGPWSLVRSLVRGFRWGRRSSVRSQVLGLDDAVVVVSGDVVRKGEAEHGRTVDLDRALRALCGFVAVLFVVNSAPVRKPDSFRATARPRRPTLLSASRSSRFDPLRCGRR